MNIAHTLIVETGREVYRVALDVPLTLFEIRDKFSKPGRHAMVVLSTDGVARVSLPPGRGKVSAWS